MTFLVLIIFQEKEVSLEFSFIFLDRFCMSIYLSVFTIYSLLNTISPFIFTFFTFFVERIEEGLKTQVDPVTTDEFMSKFVKDESPDAEIEYK